MKTIKIIDLLNKIANGEIKWSTEFKFKSKIFDIETFAKNYFLNKTMLNDEVEIIEENKIPEKLGKIEDNDGYIDQNDIIKIGRKVDEIIDYLESKEKENRYE